MKKYFLLVAVLVLLFLWSGKIFVAEAWPACNAKASTVTNHQYTCESLSAVPSSCKAGTQQCPTKEDCWWALMCCICDPDPATPPPSGSCVADTDCNTWTEICKLTPPLIYWTCVAKAAATWSNWMDCSPPVHWKNNSFGRCTCPSGTKDVDGTCTSCSAQWVCCGIELNTSVPFIGKCIESSSTNQSPDETNVTWDTAFPVLMWSLTKILVTIILIVSFILIIIGGIMIATGDPSWGRKMIMKVVVGIALLWASGVILRLINPNFFW